MIRKSHQNKKKRLFFVTYHIINVYHMGLQATRAMRQEVERMREVMKQNYEEMRQLRDQNKQMQSDVKDIKDLLLKNRQFQVY